MEKLIEKYTMDKVFEVIDKHRKYHEDYLKSIRLKIDLCRVILDDPDDMVESYLREMEDSASALATLEMLERELKGEVEY